MIVPAYLPYYVLAGAIGMIAAILFGLQSALRNAGWTTEDRTATIRAAALTVIGWFLLAIALASADAYRGTADRTPTIQYGIFVPILIGGLLIWRSPRLARIIDAVPQHWLIGVQLYRALGVIFLILYATGKLPGLFAWPAGLGDVVVGVLAPVVAIAYRLGPRENTYLVSAWNLFGLADLVVAVTAGFLTSPSPFQLFAFDLPNELVTEFPLVLIPVFLVPLSVLLHIASLAKLRRDALRGNNRRGTARAPA
ncbi:MAG TPA: hypothetical protein VIH87_12570 [Methylocella sp.]